MSNNKKKRFWEFIGSSQFSNIYGLIGVVLAFCGAVPLGLGFYENLTLEKAVQEMVLLDKITPNTEIEFVSENIVQAEFSNSGANINSLEYRINNKGTAPVRVAYIVKTVGYLEKGKYKVIERVHFNVIDKALFPNHKPKGNEILSNSYIGAGTSLPYLANIKLSEEEFEKYGRSICISRQIGLEFNLSYYLPYRNSFDILEQALEKVTPNGAMKELSLVFEISDKEVMSQNRGQCYSHMKPV